MTSTPAVRRLYQRRREAGLCVRCGEKQTRFTACLTCRLRRAEWLRRRRSAVAAVLLLAMAGIVHAQSDNDRTLVQLMNTERAKFGLAPLAWNQQLFLAAQEKAQEQVDHDGMCPAHDMCSGESWLHRIQRYYTCQWTAIGEISATTYADPQWAIDGWMASPDHRANILNNSYVESGCALRGPIPGISAWWEAVCTLGSCSGPGPTPGPSTTPRPTPRMTPRPSPHPTHVKTPRPSKTPKPTPRPKPSRTSGHM